MSTARKTKSAFDDAISRPLLSSSSGSAHHRTNPPKSASVAPPAALFKQQTSFYRPPFPTVNRRDDDEDQTITFLEQDLQGIDLEEALLQERHGEFVTIHGNMQQINAIYRDLAHIVDSQQEHFDGMEMNALEAQDSMESGMRHLNKAASIGLSQHFGERTFRLVSGLFVAVALFMAVYMLFR